VSNYLLYRVPVLSPRPLPQGAVYGSIIDFMVVIPLLTYFFIIRKRYSLKYMGLAILAGYGAAMFIIPNQHFQQFSFVTYLVLVSEGLLILLELYILYKVITKIPKIIKEITALQTKSSYFRMNAHETISTAFPNNKLVSIWVTELSMFYYALFSWKKKAHAENGEMYTYHMKTSSIAVYIMLIHATVLESIGLHYFLNQWNGMVALILLIFNVYGVIYFLAEIQAIRTTPFLLTEKELHLYVGLSKGMSIPLEEVSVFKSYDGPAKIPKEELKGLYIATVPDLDIEPSKPQFELILKNQVDLHLMYGIKKKVSRLVLNVDQPTEFYDSLNGKLQAIKKKNKHDCD
jgi:hypothetical protein